MHSMQPGFSRGSGSEIQAGISKKTFQHFYYILLLQYRHYFFEHKILVMQ